MCDLSLSLLLLNSWLIHVRSKTLTPDKQALIRHDLHLLQHCCVSDIFPELFVNFSHGSWPQPPKNREDVCFGRRWQWKRVLVYT